MRRGGAQAKPRARPGSFTQEDPIGLAGGLNLYGFAGGDPTNFSDPFGLAPCETSTAWTEGLVQALANWGARRGGRLGDAALTVAASANVALEGFGLNAAASTGDAIGSGRLVEGGVGLTLALAPIGRTFGGLAGATPALRALFAEGGGLAERSLIGLRSALLRGGFTVSLTDNKLGYLFRNEAGEEVRLMRGEGGWYARIMNKFGNYLDVNGNPGSDATTHLPVANQ